MEIKDIKELEKIALDFRGSGKTVVTVNGTFDVIHSGHLNLLEQAKKMGDYLFVLVNSDESVRGNKLPGRPIIRQEERAKMLAGLRAVDFVAIFPDSTPLNYLSRIRPHVHFKGGSYSLERTAEEKKLIESWGGRIEYTALIEGISTTEIIKRILETYGESKSL